MRKISAYQINVNGKILDYRVGKNLDLNDVKLYFQSKYKVEQLWTTGRHVVGLLKKGRDELFLKLATTQGISAVTKIEYSWNEEFNSKVSRRSSKFWAPINYDCGYYNDLFYLITDRLDGQKLSDFPKSRGVAFELIDSLEEIIEFSELIQGLDVQILSYKQNFDYRKRFVNKTISWYKNIPEGVREEYQVDKLLKIVKQGTSKLSKKPRHGDFTPWHMMKLKTRQLALIDGEHAATCGVEYYDLGYFIQRVFSVLENAQLAEKILRLLKKRGYNLGKLKVILAARAIGGFLDESLTSSPNYIFAEKLFGIL